MKTKKDLDNQLKDILLKYAKRHIDRLPEKFYNKKEIKNTLKDGGIYHDFYYGDGDNYEIIENFKEEGIDEYDIDAETLKKDLIQVIDQTIDEYCEYFTKKVNKEFLLNLTTRDIAIKHLQYWNIPSDFPEIKKSTLREMIARLRIPLKEFIKYGDKEIKELPVYSKLKSEEGKKLREIDIKNYIRDINEYLDKMEEVTNE